MLEFFRELGNHTESSPHDFYHIVIQNAADAGLSPETYDYDETTLVLHLWNDLQLHKRDRATHGASSIPAFNG
ncbi:hypothetical protein BDM02DRAFT_3123118 [Thelephora ganbajun]|uniref:Uncharacterized protein n=1 Tax=Thelephora ganbajun TaxID=370292 RepID=A0ACB6Z252_THEGA|nr:hypothetical protein BDM02DRAFT_3123118 [Thelephora ganbajun]